MNLADQPDSSFNVSTNTIPRTAAVILDQLARKDAPLLNLLALSRTEEYRKVWEESPQVARRFAQLLIKQGHPTLALEVAARSLDVRYPGDPDLLYYRALALARCGNPTRARWFVDELLKVNHLPPNIRIDTLSLAGRVRKDLANRAGTPAVRISRFREAMNFYRQGYDLSKDTFPGINAATLALLAGERELSRMLATQVRDATLDELDKSRGEDFWQLATLGEAYLLLGDNTAAKGRYSQALRIARNAHNVGDIATMLRQLRLIHQHLPLSEELLSLFHVGPVVVFAGHGLDRPGDPVRFPADPALEAAVRREIKYELDAIETNIGYYCPGCGSDILFGELMRDRNAESHIVLPFDENDFYTDRLTYGLPEFESWKKRYEELRGFLRVTRHFATKEQFLNDRLLYDFAGTFMQGLALTRAGQVDTNAIALVVQDRTQYSTTSGLSTFVANWQRTGRELRVIDLAEIRSRVQISTSISAPPPDRPSGPIARRAIRTMLFADVAGFSGLPEAHLPAFFIEFLALVEKELKTARTLFQNTWGDGLYIVFDDVLVCADFALRLLERLETFDFASFGFELNEDKKPGVRIGLHTGPVFEGFDAIMGKNNYFGSHVSRAARIEPITMPGSAFVSEQFAATLALETDHDFVCEYLGLMSLAKDYDVCHLYRLTTGKERSFA